MREMDAQEFVRRFKTILAEQPGSRFAFFLGAGCSLSSGIPTAGQIVKNDWLPKLKKIKTRSDTGVEEWAKNDLKKEGIPYDPSNPALFYGDIIEHLFLIICLTNPTFLDTGIFVSAYPIQKKVFFYQRQNEKRMVFVAESTPREKIRRTIRHDEPDRIPLTLGECTSTTMTLPVHENLKKHLGIEGGGRMISKFFPFAFMDEKTLNYHKIDTCSQYSA